MPEFACRLAGRETRDHDAAFFRLVFDDFEQGSRYEREVLTTLPAVDGWQVIRVGARSLAIGYDALYGQIDRFLAGGFTGHAIILTRTRAARSAVGGLPIVCVGRAR